MTTQRYAKQACSDESKVCGDASYVWIQNFNNGNANINNRNNKFFGRAVRRVAPGECRDAAVTFKQLHKAWRAARRRKAPSSNQTTFDCRWPARLLDLKARLNAGTWAPAPTVCFVAQRPKAREIHAPDFSDRVVHHWLVPQLESIWEPRFVHDSFANRRGKGSHAAVRRLQKFVREVDSGQGPAWYLQLDIHNFFNSIHRPTLYAMLSKQLQRAGAPEVVRRATHSLLRYPVARQGVVHRSSPAERALVPRHKRLENAASGRGLPIGNLSSQFFANVYLDALDQFVKHTLKCRRYLRYVDDFVLVHHDRAQLLAWQHQIEQFLANRLRLKLKADIRLRPVRSGIDFLGYVVYPHHTAVRSRVIRHARAALTAWGAFHAKPDRMSVTPIDLEQVRAVWRSYLGHFQHANSRGLVDSFHRRYGWLRSVTEVKRRFALGSEYREFTIRISQ